MSFGLFVVPLFIFYLDSSLAVLLTAQSCMICLLLPRIKSIYASRHLLLGQLSYYSFSTSYQFLLYFGVSIQYIHFLLQLGFLRKVNFCHGVFSKQLFCYSICLDLNYPCILVFDMWCFSFVNFLFVAGLANPIRGVVVISSSPNIAITCFLFSLLLGIPSLCLLLSFSQFVFLALASIF